MSTASPTLQRALRTVFDDVRRERYSLAGRISDAAAETDRNPTDDQKRAGNYRKGRFWMWGLELVIENPKGSVRSGRDGQGRAWSVTMPAHYGYIRRTLSEADGDHVDCFIGPHPSSEVVFVVNQQTPGGRFDEHKVVLGCRSRSEARKLYLSAYSAGWKGLRSLVAMTRGQFLKWLHQDGATKKPAVERYAAEFDESKHPRDDVGRFVEQGITHRQFKGTEPVPVSVADDAEIISKADAIKRGLTLRGSFKNKSTDWTIHVYADSIRHSIQRHGLDFRAITALPQLAENAILFASEPNRDSKKPFDRVHHFYSPLRIGDEMYLARLTVVEKQGDFEVSDQRLYHLAAHKSEKLASERAGASTTEVASAVSRAGKPDMNIGQLIAAVKEKHPDHVHPELLEKYAHKHKPDSDQKSFRWVTIGGHEEDGKEHAGGTPVLLDGEGRIASHPTVPALHGKKPHEVGKKQPAKDGSGEVSGSDVAAKSSSGRKVSESALSSRARSGGHAVRKATGRDPWTLTSDEYANALDPAGGKFLIGQDDSGHHQEWVQAALIYDPDSIPDEVLREYADAMPNAANELAERNRSSSSAVKLKQNNERQLGEIRGGKGRFAGVTTLDELKTRMKPGEKLSIATYGGGTQAEVRAVLRGKNVLVATADMPNWKPESKQAEPTKEIDPRLVLPTVRPETPERATSQPTVPGQQQNLFNPDSQGKLFNVSAPKSSTKSTESAVPKSELEKISDADEERAAANKPLDGQRELVDVGDDRSKEAWESMTAEEADKLHRLDKRRLAYDAAQQAASDWAKADRPRHLQGYLTQERKADLMRQGVTLRDYQVRAVEEQLGQHKNHVEGYLARGIYVPDDVLQEYPDLVARQRELSKAGSRPSDDAYVRARKATKAARKTGVNTRLVTIEKPSMPDSDVSREPYGMLRRAFDAVHVERYELKPSAPAESHPKAGKTRGGKKRVATSQRARQPGDGTPGWQKVGGSSVFVNGDGKITKGCPGLKGEHVNDLIGEDDLSRDRRAARQAHAEAAGKTGKDLKTADLKKLESPAAQQKHAAARSAARATGVPTRDVLRAMTEEHQRMSQDHLLFEQARAEARKMTGLNSGRQGFIENAYRDHSTVPGFDEGARTFAYAFQHLGFDPDDTENPQKVWDFIREGAKPAVKEWSQEVADSAAERLMRDRKAAKRVQKQPSASADDGFGDSDGFDDFDNFSGDENGFDGPQTWSRESTIDTLAEQLARVPF